jgi:Zn finger protein HypA/HybF involved in hydrogenase expression
MSDKDEIKLKKCKCGNEHINIAHEHHNFSSWWSIWCPRCWPKTHIINTERKVVIKEWNDGENK